MVLACFAHVLRVFAHVLRMFCEGCDLVREQAVNKSATSAASLRGGRASGRLDHDHYFLHDFAALAAKQICRNCMTNDICDLLYRDSHRGLMGDKTEFPKR